MALIAFVILALIVICIPSSCVYGWKKWNKNSIINTTTASPTSTTPTSTYGTTNATVTYPTTGAPATYPTTSAPATYPTTSAPVATTVPTTTKPTVIMGRYVRVRQPALDCLNISEIQVFSGGVDVARGKSATMSSLYTGPEGPNFVASKVVDGLMNTFAHTACGPGQGWIQVDLGTTMAINQVTVHNRVDCCSRRQLGAVIEILNSTSVVVWTSAPFTDSTGSAVFSGDGETGIGSYSVFPPSTDVKRIRARPTVGDVGYTDGKYPRLARKRGWYDASGQDVPNDYCRYVGNVGQGDGIVWSCHRADGFDDKGVLSTKSPALYTGVDAGYTDGTFNYLTKKRGYYTFGNGKEGYCRYVGTDPIDWSCNFGDGKAFTDPTNTIGNTPAS